MTRTILISSGILIALVVALYLFVFAPTPKPDPKIAQLLLAAETLCLSNSTSFSTATIQSKLNAVKGLNASATAGTNKAATHGALTSLSDTLETEQDDKIRTCMTPFVNKMLALP